MKKKRAKQTSPTVDSTNGLDPFATVPDGQQLLEEARVAAGLAAAVDTEAPTRPMDVLIDGVPPQSIAADHEDDASGRSTGKSNRPTSVVEAPPIDLSRGVETFGRRSHNAYMPPESATPSGGPWSGQGHDSGYAPAPHAWSESQPQMWADPSAQQNGWQGYPQQPQGVYTQQNGYPQVIPQQPKSTAHLGLKPNFAAMLCYLPYLGIVGSILIQQNEPKENRFVRYHARQALVAHILFWALTIAFAIAQAAAPRVAGVLIGVGASLFHLGALVGLVWMMVRVYKGRSDKIPIIGEQVDV